MGTSPYSLPPNNRLWDHPHAYGDKACHSSFSPLLPGSSPRVWGQDLRLYRKTLLTRIIPTRMGTSLKRKTACREGIGSSPRVWGQANGEIILSVTGRIIPTRMGTSRSADKQEVFPKDHPHAYGDKGIRRLNRSHSPGSSPRVWGQVTTLQPTASGIRIIPTRMGTSGR